MTAAATATFERITTGHYRTREILKFRGAIKGHASIIRRADGTWELLAAGNLVEIADRKRDLVESLPIYTR